MAVSLQFGGDVVGTRVGFVFQFHPRAASSVSVAALDEKSCGMVITM